MTKKERRDFNQMEIALTRICSYDSISTLREKSEEYWGLGYIEALESSYRKVLEEARDGLEGIRELVEL